MVEPRADDADRHRDQSDVQGGVTGAAQRPVTAIGPPYGDEDPGEDAQGVGAQRERADVPHAPGGARDGSGKHSENLSVGGGNERGMTARGDQLGDELLGVG